jgi:hypothetical protein
LFAMNTLRLFCLISIVSSPLAGFASVNTPAFPAPAPPTHAIVQPGFGEVRLGKDIDLLPFSCLENPCTSAYQNALVQVTHKDHAVSRVDVIYKGKSLANKEFDAQLKIAQAVAIHSLRGAVRPVLLDYQDSPDPKGVVDVANCILYSANGATVDSHVDRVTYQSCSELYALPLGGDSELFVEMALREPYFDPVTKVEREIEKNKAQLKHIGSQLITTVAKQVENDGMIFIHDADVLIDAFKAGAKKEDPKSKELFETMNKSFVDFQNDYRELAKYIQEDRDSINQGDLSNAVSVTRKVQAKLSELQSYGIGSAN